MTITRFSFPTDIHFGPGARKLVAPYLIEAGVRRPLIVTDRALAALPVLAEFRTHLAGLDVGGLRRRLRQPDLRDGDGRRTQPSSCTAADAVIGFGGGAALDVAKLVGLMAVHDGDVLEYVWDHPQVRPIVNPLPHFVALPTTAGTGSEVGRSSVVSENDTHHQAHRVQPADPAARGLRRPRTDAWRCRRPSPRPPAWTR